MSLLSTVHVTTQACTCHYSVLYMSLLKPVHVTSQYCTCLTLGRCLQAYNHCKNEQIIDEWRYLHLQASFLAVVLYSSAWLCMPTANITSCDATATCCVVRTQLCDVVWLGAGVGERGLDQGHWAIRDFSSRY